MNWLEVVLRLGFVSLVLFVALWFLMDLHRGRRKAIVNEYFKGDYSLWNKFYWVVVILLILFLFLRFVVF
jgi:hypothetical protein